MIRVGLIGLGKIAALYSSPDDPHPYCHAGGIRQCAKTELACAADPDDARREGFSKTWGVPCVYSSAEQMLAKEAPDVVAVCVKGPWHHEHAVKAIDAGAKVVFLEKPAGCSLREVDDMTQRAQAAGCCVVVSYTRHWGPHVLAMAELVRQGLVGDVKTVVGHCGGGILGFAVHNADMLLQFAGYDPVAVQACTELTDQADVPDGYQAEVHVRSAIVEHSSGTLSVLVGDPGKHGQFAVEVLGTEGWARVGFYEAPQLYDDKGRLVDDASRLPMPEPASPFLVAYNQIAAYLEGGPVPECGPAQYVPVNEAVFGMIESGARGARITVPTEHRDRAIYCMG